MRRRRGTAVHGVLLLDKPPGLSSNAALQRARRALDAQKAGHTGTLDPLASGLLPICFGEATKFAQFLLDAHKRYEATVRFGVTTDTLDAEGEVTATQPVDLDAATVAAALAASTGPQLQTPPAHAALKHRGKAYYEYARAGEDIPRVARPIEVTRLTLLEWRSPDAVLDVECSKGTYVRVLAADLGQRLGCGAHLLALRRTATGGFGLEQAVPLDRLEALDPGERRRWLLPIDVLTAQLPRLVVDPPRATAFVQGQPIAAPGAADGVHAVFDGHGLIGVADVAAQRAQPRRVVARAPQDDAQAA